MFSLSLRKRLRARVLKRAVPRRQSGATDVPYIIIRTHFVFKSSAESGWIRKKPIGTRFIKTTYFFPSSQDLKTKSKSFLFSLVFNFSKEINLNLLIGIKIRNANYFVLYFTLNTRLFRFILQKESSLPVFPFNYDLVCTLDRERKFAKI